jgi:hypothetical protein
VAVCIFCFGFLVKFCEKYNINYPYLLEIPSEAYISGNMLILVGMTYVSMVFLAAIFAASSENQLIDIPLPFSFIIKKFSLCLD